MRFYFISALFIFVLISCRKIDKKDLKVIDNIQLGLSYDSFIKQLDSLGIKKSPCFRSMTSLNIIEDTDIISGKACLIYYTENLNYGFYHGRENLHIGVLYPSYFSNNQSVFQLTVLLGAQKKPQYIGNRKNKFEIENEYIIFTQIMNELLIIMNYVLSMVMRSFLQKIRMMYSRKLMILSLKPTVNLPKININNLFMKSN